MAKRIIKLITAIGATVNNDPIANRFMKVVFLPNFNVKTAHLVYLAGQPLRADLDGRQEGLHRQHEVHAQRRADDRHARRRERREIWRRPAVRTFPFGLTEDQVETVKATVTGRRPTRTRSGTRPQLELIASGRFHPRRQ